MNTPLQFDMFEGDQPLLDRMRVSWWKAAEGQGAICPCCDRKGKVYRIKLHRTFAYALRWTYLNGEKDGWVDVQNKGPRFILKSKNYGMLTHWGMLESAGNRSGLWRVTQKGKDFMDNLITVPSSIFIYDNKAWGESDEQVSFQGCFKEAFDYDEMMSARFDWSKIQLKKEL